VSGVLTLWEDPIERESKRIGRLRNRTNELAARYPNSGDSVKALIQTLSLECNQKLDELDRKDYSATSFAIEKLIALFAAGFSLASLLYSSEYSNVEITSTLRTFAYFLLFVTPLLVIGLSIRVGIMTWNLKDMRLQLDRKYVGLVNQLAEQ
jgi:hypothetical protein